MDALGKRRVSLPERSVFEGLGYLVLLSCIGVAFIVLAFRWSRP